jgi:hypothetical protein
LFARVSPSVWVVRTFDAQARPLRAGSAVAVAPGRLVTNCHVLAKANSLVIRKDNVTYGATLEYPDVEHDLCQIKVANFNAPTLAIAPASSVRVGQRVYAIGSPRGLENTLSEGLLSGLRDDRNGEARLLQTSAALSAGSSGGGLFDAEGRLLGITTYGLKDANNLNFAVPADLIAEIPERAQAALAKRSHGEDRSARATPAQTNRPAEVTPAQTDRTAGVASAQTTPSALSLADPLRVGDALEYALTDRSTGNRSSVIYRFDRITGDELVFNMGGRVEKRDGSVISVTTPIGGLFDTSSPPGGWGRKNAKPGMRWSLDYLGNTSDKFRHDLDVTVTGESSMKVDGADIKVLQIAYKGWVYAPITNSGSSRTGTPFRATVWYAADLGRVVRFEAENNRGGYASSFNESLELVRVLR